MPRRSGCSNIAIIGGVALGVALALLIGHWAGNGFPYPGQTYKHDYQRAYSYLCEPARGGAPVVEGSVPNRAVSDGPKPHEQYDLCQQWRMAEAAERSIGIGLVQLGFGFFGILGLIATVIFTAIAASAAGRSAEHAREAVVTMRETADLENRAWLKLTPVAVGPIGHDGRNLKISATVKAENIGESPATNVFINLIAYQARGLVVGRDEVKRVVAHTKMIVEATDALGLIVLPDDYTTSGFNTDATEFPRRGRVALRDGAEYDEVPLVISAVYCVFYKTFGFDEWRHSAQAMWITKRDGSPFDPADGDVPAEMLSVNVLSPHSDIS